MDRWVRHQASRVAGATRSRRPAPEGAPVGRGGFRKSTRSGEGVGPRNPFDRATCLRRAEVSWSGAARPDRFWRSSH